MKITKNIYVVASGRLGFNFTHPLDCNVFLVDTGEGYILIDAGVGLAPEQIAQCMAGQGLNPKDIKAILLTHYHGDHAGGAQYWQQVSGCKVYAPAKEAEAIRTGDETANSVALAKGGFYPADYQFKACPCTALQDGEAVTVGNVTLTAYALAGHSLEGVVYHGEIDGMQCMFTGDGVFAAGQILLQSLHDVSILPYAVGMNRLAELTVDALFPGHGVFCLRDGAEHIKVAAARFNQGLIPPQLYYFT